MTTPNLNDYDATTAAQDYIDGFNEYDVRNRAEHSTKTPGCSTSTRKANSSSNS